MSEAGSGPETGSYTCTQIRKVTYCRICTIWQGSKAVSPAYKGGDTDETEESNAWLIEQSTVWGVKWTGSWSCIAQTRELSQKQGGPFTCKPEIQLLSNFLTYLMRLYFIFWISPQYFNVFVHVYTVIWLILFFLTSAQVKKKRKPKSHGHHVSRRQTWKPFLKYKWLLPVNRFLWSCKQVK